MKTFAYCRASFERSVRRAAGVQPLLSPPVCMDTLHPGELRGHYFYYFNLHGLPGEIYWYGDNWQTAIGLHQLQAVGWTEAVVFVANCYGLTVHGEPDRMVQAILDGGASAVVAGMGTNYATAGGLVGADLLGAYFRLGVRMHLGPERAFSVAMGVLRRWYSAARLGRLPEGQRLAAKDTLGFRIFVRGDLRASAADS